jgi:hypothetical protein
VPRGLPTTGRTAPPSLEMDVPRVQSRNASPEASSNAAHPLFLPRKPPRSVAHHFSFPRRNTSVLFTALAFPGSLGGSATSIFTSREASIDAPHPNLLPGKAPSIARCKPPCPQALRAVGHFSKLLTQGRAGVLRKSDAAIANEFAALSIIGRRLQTAPYIFRAGRT